MASDTETAPPPQMDDALRARLIARPELILDDIELMRALMLVRESEVGGNVIDIRGRAMEALESRLGRLETAHENVISAAYDNLAGTKTVHRAVISLMEPQDLAGFVENLPTAVAPILRVESLALLLEGPAEAPGAVTVEKGVIATLISAGRRHPRGDEIVLRASKDVTAGFHAADAGQIRSEALLPLDLRDAGQGLLLMGSVEPDRFSPAQGTDLLRFFGQVTRLALLRWFPG